MIDALINSLRDEAAGELLEKTGVQQNQLDGIFNVVKDSATKELGSNIAQNGLSTVMNLFSNKDNNSLASNLQSNIVSSITNGLMERLGMSSNVARMVSGIVVPKLIAMVTKKNNETPEDDASPIQNLLGGDLGGIAGKALGGLF